MGFYNHTAETERLLTENYERYYRLAFKLMRNQDMLRRKKKETPTEEMPETPTEDHYQDLDLKQMINRLDDKSRTVILLRYFEDLKLEEIADIAGENLNTVKARLYRALKKLRLELEPESLGGNQNHFSERSHAHETGKKQTDG